jgi:parvulin-like peptidyl-prolyl isomerase
VVKDQDQATDIYNKLLDGASFKELAYNNSISVTAKSHGRVGPFKKSRLPEYWAVADTLEEGEFTHPIFKKGGWAIIKLEKRYDKMPMERDFATKLAMSKLLKQKKQDKLDAYLNSLKKEHKVRISKLFS